MSLNVNVVILGGRLTRDVELRTLPSGTAVANIGFACDRKFKKNDEWCAEPVFVDVAMFGKKAEVVARHFKKGDPIFVEGKLTFEQWDDKTTGDKRSKLRVIADDFQFVNAKGEQRHSDDGPFREDEKPF